MPRPLFHGKGNTTQNPITCNQLKREREREREMRCNERPEIAGLKVRLCMYKKRVALPYPIHPLPLSLSLSLAL